MLNLPGHLRGHLSDWPVGVDEFDAFGLAPGQDAELLAQGRVKGVGLPFQSVAPTAPTMSPPWWAPRSRAARWC